MVAASLASDGSQALESVKLLLPLSGDYGGCRLQDNRGNIALHHTEDIVECSEAPDSISVLYS